MKLYENIISSLLIFWIVIQIISRIISSKRIDCLINDYCTSQGLQVCSICKLTIAEKLQYGVPLNFITRFYSFFFTIFTRLGEDYYRKVEVFDDNHNTHIHFIEAYIRNRKLIRCKIYKSYDL